MRWVMIKYILLLIFYFFSNHASTSELVPYIVLNEAKQTEVNEYSLWYQTEIINRNPTFEKLNQLSVKANPVASTLAARGAYLTKIKITNSNPINDIWFVNISAVYLDIGTAYWQTAKGEIKPLENFGQLKSQNPKIAHSQTFSLPLKYQETGTLWVYVQAKLFATPAVIKIYNKSEFYNKQFLVNSIDSISFGVMITLALIALFVYLRTGYLVTLACAGYIGIQGVGWLMASGSFGHLLAVSTYNPVYIGIILFPFAVASASQFTKLLFNCPRDYLRLNKVFNILSIVCLALGMIMPFLPFVINYVISHIIAAIWIPLCIGTGVFMLAKKDFRAKYYLIGNALYGLSLAGFMLSHLYHISWGVSFEVIVQVALTVDCICILLSLAKWLQIQQQEFRRSYAISRIDPLTKIGNRFAQNEKLASLTGPYSITFIDLDGFKKINDQLGHDEGDKILIATAEIIQKELHDLGTVFRCGGDEFIIVASIDDVKNIKVLLIRLENILLKSEQALQMMGWQDIGLSFGIATSFEALNQSGCLSLADERMYQYKKARRQHQ
jgi:diguanylate cyclase (GGDEF)-like protein